MGTAALIIGSVSRSAPAFLSVSSAQRLAVAVVVTISVGYTITVVAFVLASGSFPAIALLVGALAGFFLPHYLHIRAALANVEPSGVPYGLVMQVVATYAPFPVFGPWWTAAAAPILAGSVLLRLGPRRGTWAMIPIMAFQAWWSSTGPYGTIASGFYYALTVFITGFVLYAVTRLVVVTRELEQARAELAEAAVLRERLRISRDLHDGLGRSLTAIALKGDLAGRLLAGLPDGPDLAGARDARREIGELVRIAREAAQDVRRVARGYREMSLAQETHRAAALLEASGVSCHVNLAEGELPRPVDETLAWAVREGVTNVLRHSAATTCSISTSRVSGAIRLEIVNNGVTPVAASGGEEPSGPGDTGLPVPAGHDGSGLTGLAERAAAVGGTVRARRTEAGGFRLTVEVPIP